MEMRKKFIKTQVHCPITKVDVDNVRKTKKVGPKPHPSKVLAKSIVSEICGFSPYEKKALSYLAVKDNKKASRFVKKRLGSVKRADKKIKDLTIKLLD